MADSNTSSALSESNSFDLVAVVANTIKKRIRIVGIGSKYRPTDVQFLFFRDSPLATTLIPRQVPIIGWQEVDQDFLDQYICTDLAVCVENQRAMSLETLRNASISELVHVVGVEDSISKLTMILARIKTVPFRRKVIKKLWEITVDRDLLKMLDTNPCIWACSNGVFEYSTQWFRAGRAGDYVLKTCGIPYIPSEVLIAEIRADDEPNDYDLLNQVLKTTFPYAQDLCTLENTIMQAMMGSRLSILFFGGPRSGQTTILRIIEEMFGDYYNKLPMEALLGDPSVLIRALKHRFQGLRLIGTQEPSMNEQLNPVCFDALRTHCEQTNQHFSLIIQRPSGGNLQFGATEGGKDIRFASVAFRQKFSTKGEEGTLPAIVDLHKRISGLARALLSRIIEHIGVVTNTANPYMEPDVPIAVEPLLPTKPATAKTSTKVKKIWMIGFIGLDDSESNKVDMEALITGTDVFNFRVKADTSHKAAETLFSKFLKACPAGDEGVWILLVTRFYETADDNKPSKMFQYKCRRIQLAVPMKIWKGNKEFDHTHENIIEASDRFAAGEIPNDKIGYKAKGIVCSECESNEIFQFHKRRRSEDESYDCRNMCAKCGHKWNSEN